MSHSSSHALSTRLFLQAAVTGLLAPLTKGGSTWLVITFAVAAGAVGVAMLLRSNPANAKVTVVGFEAVAVAVGAVGIAGGHYIPGTIVGIATLIAALNMHAVAAPGADSEPASEDAEPAAVGPAPPAPITPPVPVMNSPAPVVPAGPVLAPPTPVVVPEQAVAPEAATQDETGEAEATQAEAPKDEAPKDPEPEVPAAEVTQPMRPEDIPPAPRALTILPGR